MEHEYDVVCETDGCPNKDTVINHISEIYDAEALEDDWGQGSEEPDDYCKGCNRLGVLHEC